MFFTKFKKNRRGYFSFLIFSLLFFFTLFAEFVANDKPLLMRFSGSFYFPVFEKISEKKLDGVFESEADFRDPFVQNLIEKNGWAIFPPIRFSYDTINYKITSPAPSKPGFENFLGTDDQGRDVLARVIYGIRISLIFGLILTFFSAIFGIFLGAIQGYFGGLCDLLLQRFMEIWSSMPVLFLLIILSSIIEPNFFTLLGLMLIFSWMSLVSYVRAEFLRLRNFDFVRASKALGAGNLRIIFRHILPNASPIIIANLPFLLAASITTLTSLDFLGLGLPAGSPSLGELLAQGKNNLSAYWLGISGFIVITLILTLLVFIGEAMRDAFDVRRS
ncbi:MAG: ABC transporter permease [Alphaproteobacteria bacterium RIFCSPLOWO2_01_FULL_40_26]|nr:MAG: ABC transporter permease [Alphaproteobacteria bacterium RIFCSPHIGHO2_02_FULL_40_34]OFW94697.1 MAG: ABC transporter permease [Alphaproteobacteria bacterium RIFCSPLOWO2_01_FULL_40_26]OFX10165.1 MAG: ABC transporter permease [Alphaproteobacteria bacterium RIFCSPLOWO2_02_FULL_40_19]OFX11794.1 MAG: ABC transporter permease [Alphaproteobacteria bacterium RIFCSPLOWO2_12_FULL_40_11]